MRPVNKPTPPVVQDSGTVKTSQLGGLLLATLGRYCSFCERPLDDPVLIQSKRSDKTRFTFGDWQDLFLVCPDCNAGAQAAFQDKENFKADGQSLWPDAGSYALTLSRDTIKGGPFQYALRQVNVVSVTASGGRKSLPSQEQVIVTVDAASRQRDAAWNTLKLFALNTRYYDERSNTMVIPFEDYQQIDDQRVLERTAAWQLATAASQRLERSAAVAALHAVMAEQIADTARAVGFWSIWMTVFWQAFGDADLLGRLFIEVERRDRFVFYGFTETSKTGPALFFPGTDKSRVTYLT